MEELYSAYFYNKYNIDQCVKFTNLSLQTVNDIKENFNREDKSVGGVINLNFNIESNFKSIIDLSNFSYVEFKKQNP